MSNGNFVWYDLMSSDPAGSEAFYTALIGWGTQDWDGDMPYRMWTNNEKPLGGVMQLPQEAADAGAPSHWLAYVATPNVDSTAEQAVELGATVVVPPTDIPGAGRFAILTDPQGATFATFQEGTESEGSSEPRGVGEFSWHELMTNDYEAAIDFYSPLFGWQKQEAMDMGESGIYQMYGQPESPPLGGMFNRPPEVPVNAWLFYISVPDIHAAAEKTKSLGGQILHGPMEVPGGDMIVQCLDPQGAMFALHSSAAAN